MKKVPVVMLSGFLGSGKTTLLANILEYALNDGLRPAVIMNEVGDVNLDGQAVNESVPMREMLSGCICCTIRGDLGMEIRQLVQEASPDIVLIEATGVANPMEVLDAVTEAALLQPIDIQAMVTVVDLAHFLRWQRTGTGRTYRLMVDQIRCASVLFLNKSDLVSVSELEEMILAIHGLNPHALLFSTVKCEVNRRVLEQIVRKDDFATAAADRQRRRSEEAACGHDHSREQSHNHAHDHSHDHHHHDGHHHHDHSYDHVMVSTHYFQRPIELDWFEQIIGQLPDRVYRAKGIFTAAGSGERMMFQYAFRQLDMFRIHPQGNIQDVAVFIGEQFPEQELKMRLEQYP